MGFFDFINKKNKSDAVEDKLKALAPRDEDLKQEVIECIRQEILFGFADEAEIQEAVLDIGFDYEEELNIVWVQQTVSAHYAAYREESKAWKRPTDFDRLAKAFDALNQQQIIALHKAGYTKQDGYSDVSEVMENLDSSIKPIGFCFYHTQGLERAVDPDIRSLYLAFDDIQQNDENAIQIGKTIVEKLNENGLQTEWDGTIDQRIKIANIRWQKVSDGQDWGMERAIRFLSGV